MTCYFLVLIPCENLYFCKLVEAITIFQRGHSDIIYKWNQIEKENIADILMNNEITKIKNKKKNDFTLEIIFTLA